MTAIFLDTNVLVDATNRARETHERAIRLLSSGAELVMSAQIVREYLAVATRPAGRNGLGFAPAQAKKNMDELRRIIRLLPEERPLLPTLLSLFKDPGCQGRAIHDANIVAAMRVHGIDELVTANSSDFARYEGLIRVRSLG